MAHKLKIGLQVLQEFRVFIGSGEYLVCREVCKQVSLIIQEVTIKNDLYVPMEGVNVVLGIQWLETLGVIVCVYKKLTMYFQHTRYKQVRLQGDILAQISNGGLKTLVGREEVAYFCQLQAETPTCQVQKEQWTELQEVLKKIQKLRRNHQVCHHGGPLTTTFY